MLIPDQNLISPRIIDFHQAYAAFEFNHQSYGISCSLGLPNCVLRLWLSSNSFFSLSNRILRIGICFNCRSSDWISWILSYSYYRASYFCLSSLSSSWSSFCFSRSFRPAVYFSYIAMHCPRRNLIGRLRIWASIISKFMSNSWSS